MAGWSDAEEAAILNWYFRQQAKTPPAQTYLALFTAQPNDDGTYTEIAYTGYARQTLPDTIWDPPSGTDPTAVANNADITFDVMTGGAGGTANYWGLFDAVGAGAGNMLFSGQVTVPSGGLVITIGVQPQFAVGSLFARLGG